VTGLQLAALLIMLVAIGVAASSSWHEAAERLRHADRGDIVLGCLFIALYYLAFIIGWMRILKALGSGLPYREALRAEMLSLLAKYVPGAVWTPAARVVACRRVGITDTSLVLASIAFEAGLSAIAGVLVFVLSLPTVGTVKGSTIAITVAFAVACAVVLHPRVFAPLARRIMRSDDAPSLRYTKMLELVAYYSFTWLIGGVGLFFLCRSVGDPPPSSIPFMGGASAVGAIVAVVFVFAPSGIGVREASVARLLEAVVPSSVAIATVALNRLAITVVEAALLGVTALLPRSRAADEDAAGAHTTSTGEAASSSSLRT
jgi:uncharacterized membrane protein YbhN (UPF0104 family)